MTRQAELAVIQDIQAREFRNDFECLERLKELKKGSEGEKKFWKKNASKRVGQLSLYIDDSEGVSILRCRKRLQYSQLSEDTKNPILLPRAHKVTRLLIE